VIFSVEALVLDKEKRKEIDLLVTLLTPRGKVRSLAKGAQKSLKRFLNLLEPLTHLRVHLRKPQRGKILILEGADLLNLPESPRRDLGKFFYFNYFAEMMDFAAQEAFKGPDFAWLTGFLKDFDRDSPSFEAKLWFELRWLEICGLYPEVGRCLRCGREPRRIYYFSLPAGGLLCFSCRDETAQMMQGNQIDLLRKIVRIKKLKEAKAQMEALSKSELFSVARLIEDFLIYHLDWEPRSLRMLKELPSEDARGY